MTDTSIKNIVVAVDGSGHSEDAAGWVARLPHLHPWSVTLASVVNPPHLSFHDHPMPPWTEEVLRQQEAEVRQSARRIESLFPPDSASVEHLILRGGVGESLVSLAEKRSADLVVVGAKGHSAISRILLGSTSDFVATHTACSVLVVRNARHGRGDDARPDDARPDSGPPDSGDASPAQPHRLKIMLAYEASGAARAALEELAETRWGTTAHIDVVSIVPSWPDFYNESPDEVDKRVGDELRLAAAALEEIGNHVATRVIAHDHVGEGIVQYALHHDVDLIVLGETLRSPMGRWLMGGTSRYVLRHAPCSVWITRNRMIRGLAKPAKTAEVISQTATGAINSTGL